MLAWGTTHTIILVVLIVFVLTVFFKTIRIVPQKQAYIIERLGKYFGTLTAGFHILIPFLDKIAYKHTLKEQAVDVPPPAVHHQGQYCRGSRRHSVYAGG